MPRMSGPFQSQHTLRIYYFFLRDGDDDQKKRSSKAWAAAVLLLSSIDADGDFFFIEYAKDLCIFVIKVEKFVTDNAFQRVL